MTKGQIVLNPTGFYGGCRGDLDLSFPSSPSSPGLRSQTQIGLDSSSCNLGDRTHVLGSIAVHFLIGCDHSVPSKTIPYSGVLLYLLA